jgi:hypothetical protein
MEREEEGERERKEEHRFSASQGYLISSINSSNFAGGIGMATSTQGQSQSVQSALRLF